MIKSYFKTAWRNMWRNSTFAIIKISGLGIGLTVCMLILLYSKDEISYDRFHRNNDNIYRLVQTMQMGQNAPQNLGITQPVLGDAYKRNIPEIQQFVRINGGAVTIRNGIDVFTETSLFVDSNFFSVFTFPLIRGNAYNVLRDVHSLVLTEDAAKKYFGTTDVIGKVLDIKTDTAFERYSVTAVAENPPQNSTIKFAILLPFEYRQNPNEHIKWVGGSLNTFVLLSPKAKLQTVVNKIQSLFDENTKEQIAQVKKEEGITVTIKESLQPLTDIHLSAKFGPGNGLEDGSSLTYSYILTCISIFILIIACINFINLSLAQSLKRSKEIGIRKVIGSSRKQLIGQFLTESFFVSLLAFIIAIFLSSTILPFFNELSNKKLNFSYLMDFKLCIGYSLLLICTSFIAGSYPALYLSSFQPVKALYSNRKLMGKNYLTKSFIVFQFALSIFLIIGAIAVNSQLNFLFHAKLGYKSENLVRIDLPPTGDNNKLVKVFKNELVGDRSIEAITAKNGGSMTTAVSTGNKNIEVDNNTIDDRYFPTLKISIIAGRNFSANFPSDVSQSGIVNESFVKAAGWSNKEAIGKVVSFVEDKKKITIIGVASDYHFASLKEKITPQLFNMDANVEYGQVLVKIKPSDMPHTASILAQEFKKLFPLSPYNYQFIDDINKMNYEAEAKWELIINIASGLFVFISCIGLFGLGILSVEQRTKEIGIRKVLGAAASRIFMLISKDFIVLISIAFMIAVPIGYYFSNKWLQNFAYRIDIGWWMFAVAGTFVISIALLTTSFQAIKAAVANPVKSLKTE